MKHSEHLLNLTSLVHEFNESKEASRFFVKPPAKPGSLHDFSEKYF